MGESRETAGRPTARTGPLGVRARSWLGLAIAGGLLGCLAVPAGVAVCGPGCEPDGPGGAIAAAGADPAAGNAPDPSLAGRIAALAVSAGEALGGLIDSAVARIGSRGVSLRPPADEPGPPARPASGFLIPGEASAHPGRWCRGEVAFAVDYTEAVAAGLDAATERALWRQAAAAWSQASGGAYRLRESADRVFRTAADRRSLDLSLVAGSSIGITYGGQPGAVPDDYGYQDLAGSTVGYGGLSVVTGGSPAQRNRAETGYVIIDAPDVALRLPDPGRRLQLYTHELGHALGLAHRAQEASIMSPEISLEPQSIDPLDVHHLRELAALPCSR